MAMMKFERYVVDNKKLVTEANALTRQIDILTARRNEIIERIEKFKAAMAIITGGKVVSAKKMTKPTIKTIEPATKSKKINYAAKLTGTRETPNSDMVRTARIKIVEVLNEKPMKIQEIVEKLYDDPSFKWTLSRTYLDALIRNLSVRGDIEKRPEGFVKV